MSGDADEHLTAMDLDPGGNLVLGGRTTSAKVAIGTTNLLVTLSDCLFLAKFNPTGLLLWAELMGGNGNDYLRVVASDSAGNTLAGGRFYGTNFAVGGAWTGLKRTSGMNGWVTKLDSNGGLCWARQTSSKQGAEVEDLVCDSAAGVTASGYFTSNNGTEAVGPFTLTNRGNKDIILFKLSAAGDFLGATSIGGSDADYLSSLIAVGTNEIYLAGYYGSTGLYTGNLVLTNAGYNDIFLGRLHLRMDLPGIVTQPRSQTAVWTTNVVLSCVATGSAPLLMQWRRNGTNLLTETNALLTITNVHRSDSGLYDVLVTNLFGRVTSSVANVRALVPQRLFAPTYLGNTGFAASFSDADGMPLLPPNVSGFRVEQSTNLSDRVWTALTNQLHFSDGYFQLLDVATSNSPVRFYRVVEE